MRTPDGPPLGQVLGKRSRNEFGTSTPNKERKEETTPTSYPVGKLSMPTFIRSEPEVSDNRF